MITFFPRRYRVSFSLFILFATSLPMYERISFSYTLSFITICIHYLFCVTVLQEISSRYRYFLM